MIARKLLTIHHTHRIMETRQHSRLEYSPDTDVKYVKGVGPSVAEKLNKLGIHTLRDLLYNLPKRHEDRSHFARIIDVQPGAPVTVKGRVEGAENQRVRSGLTLTKAYLDDGTGYIGLTFFNQPYLRDRLARIKGEIIVYGIPQEGRWGLEFSSPEWEEVDAEGDQLGAGRLVPIYGLTEGLNQKRLRTIMHNAVNRHAGVLPEVLPASVRKRRSLAPIAWAIRQAHFPDSEEHFRRARQRLAFEEFFFLQLILAIRRAEAAQRTGIAFDIPPDFVNQVKGYMPFELTAAQKRVIEEICADMRRPRPMNRLLQGDVGSGKTAVAACAIIAAARCGYQSALMAPTEILAEQHGRLLRDLLAPAGVSVELLVGRLTPKKKEAARERLLRGEAHVGVGTHALIQETVEFRNLGLVIIDEQHRFGVMQRAALIQKGIAADVLVMTATPIPRTLTMTLYGDLAVSVIDQLPPGRRPVKTHWKRTAERNAVYEGVRQLVGQGRQAFIVCPLITESERLQVRAAKELYERLSTTVFPEFRVGLLHGQMRGDEKDKVMTSFRDKELDILVATSVIEVGVDVPNAAVMVIEDAQRFGLSQLHQLRGRVGRSSEQAYCVLIADATDNTTEERLRIMTQTNDGFRIAEEDLRIRGPGEIYGTKQAGLPDFQVADLVADRAILEEARDEAIRLVAEGDSSELREASMHLTAARMRWGLVEVS
ncbi:MAG: ATP-dependent DNA helicase RecG [Fimbriimonadales bacterium]